jgi:hypothetical protein
VKEKRKGPIGRAAGIAEGLAATVRRMQREREPRVLVYDETGYARLVQPNGRGYESLLETAERMVALVDESEAAAKAKPRPPVEPETEPKQVRPRRAKATREGERGTASRKGTAKSRRAKTGGGGGKPRAARRSESPARGGAKPRRPRRAPGEDDA